MTLTLIVVGIFFGLAAAVIARHKGRSDLRDIRVLAYYLLHIVGLIVLFLPPVPKVGVTKKCPDCAEIIKAEAKVCRFCGHGLVDADASEVS